MSIRMRRTDPASNMDRYYSVEVTRDLFGKHIVQRHWGRRGTWGQFRLEGYPDQITAMQNMSKLVQQKLSKGYLLDGV